MNKSGFTLIEILVYIAVLAMLMSAIGAFLLWTIRMNANAEISRGTLENAGLAMNFMLREIAEANAVYEPTSIFASSPGQLSLDTKNYLPDGEDKTYIDFYVCGTQVCLKREGRQPMALTSEDTEVTSLIFRRAAQGGSESVKIEMTLRYKNPNQRPERSAEISISSSATLRAE